MVEDAPEVFDPNDSGYLDPLEEPGVAKFAKLICGRDVVYEDAQEDGEGPDCDGAKAFIIRAKQGLEDKELAEMSEDPEIGSDVWKFVENFCAEACVAEGKNCDGIFKTACTESQSALKAASNETEKTAMKTACDSACADFEEETCGPSSVANFLSVGLMILCSLLKM